MDNPDQSWIETNVWGEIKALCGIEYFKDFANVFAQRTVAWRRSVSARQPFSLFPSRSWLSLVGWSACLYFRVQDPPQDSLLVPIIRESTKLTPTMPHVIQFLLNSSVAAAVPRQLRLFLKSVSRLFSSPLVLAQSNNSSLAPPTLFPPFRRRQSVRLKRAPRGIIPGPGARSAEKSGVGHLRGRELPGQGRGGLAASNVHPQVRSSNKPQAALSEEEAKPACRDVCIVGHARLVAAGDTAPSVDGRPV